MNSISGLTSNHSKLNAIRNPDGIFINTQCFREEANHFAKHGYYTPDPWGTPAWQEYWQEQLDRCKNGYSSGGVKISGNHYGYMNFSQIKKVAPGENPESKMAKKIVAMPDFWDGDYNYYHSINIARDGITKQALDDLKLSVTIREQYLDGARHVIIGKSRRKGYSYKNGFICVNNYNTTRNALSIIGAFDKKYLYPKGTMGMATEQLNFLNEHTGWRKARDYVDKQDHRRASYKKTVEGIGIESGYMSEIMAITFKDNPDAARGKDAVIVLLEEAGAFPNLIDSFIATAPGLSAGKYITGQILIFGTGGDMESGTLDFAEMFYNPDLYGIMPFMNIWDENAEIGNCGFFHPIQWNMEGYYDEDGNSDVIGALAYEKSVRDKMTSQSSGSTVVQLHMQEYCTCPAEAFLSVSLNDFPIVELRARLNKVVNEKLYLKRGVPCELSLEEGRVKVTPDIRNLLEPIWFNRPASNNRNGAVIIYEYPLPNAPRGLYKIGYDPYRQVNGNSLASIIVYKGIQRGSFSRDCIVAEYTGRPQDPDDVNKIFELLIMLFNTEGMYENEVTHVKSYFVRRKKLNLLAAQPDAVISKAINNSETERIYGCHMNEQLKDAGEKYIKTWLLTPVNVTEDGRVLTVIDYIDSPGLLEQLIMYNRKGNYDRVSALIMVMFQINEEELGKEYNEEVKKDEKLLSLIENLYKKNR